MPRCIGFFVFVAAIQLSAHSIGQVSVHILSSCGESGGKLFNLVWNEIVLTGIRPHDTLQIGGHVYNNKLDTIYYRPQYMQELSCEVSEFDSFLVVRDGKVIHQQSLHVIQLPRPRCLVKYAERGKIRVAQLLRYPLLAVDYPRRCFSGSQYRIGNYKIDVVKKGSQTLRFESTNPFYPDELIDVIRTLSPGDKLRFSQIEAGCFDCSDRILDPVEVEIF